MKKRIAVAALAVMLAAGPAFASGYRIPEQSTNSVALSNAYVANTPGADASYYNPANMSWLEEGWHSELSLTYINLASIEYTDNNSSARSGSSRTENFALPEFHLVSPLYNNFRFGLSLVYPYGLSKRWEAPYPRMTSEEFTLKTYELNPNLSYQVTNTFSVAAGVRAIYSEGKVKSTDTLGTLGLARRDLEGSATDYGYNLAATYKPVSNLSLAATYRSKVNLEIEGDATLGIGGATVYNNRYAEVMVPAPAVLTLAAAYTFDATTVEFTYDKTYWSAYDKLDFNYDVSLLTINATLYSLFDAPGTKNWSNTDAFRLGLTHKLNTRWTVMAGFAIDKNPIPDETLGFELPDSDATIYSVGARYQVTDTLQVGAAYLYDDKENRTVASSVPKPNGTFDNAAAHLLNIGLQYRF
ncbi:MAG: outer membrane protein transport protein [Proteobacteria bacterium]|nr:outer membrane protein transport protein [Pseudomonadota bacterium]MBU4407895.1 outer membrane protein transport protein [Pseudomonadota bacterium]MBU4412475.1 outer membrane protein transport protein [Pseudomonadota bacterium]MCG2822495.1 outer membrane protein transport protein [Desulfobulbaceae bacterium]MDP2001443.1 outer membrane protein transport protein [Desulfurivibrionaceae bacterium]